MIEGKKIYKTYKQGNTEFTVLHGINIKVETGEFVSITGMSGAGKSTLLYQLSLLDRPTSGSIFIDQFDTVKLKEKQRTTFRLTYLGFVFQDFALIPDLTALENVALPLLMLGQKKKAAYKKAKKILSEMGLSDRLNNTPGKLSGGQQQRVSVARAIVNKPKILFADEPTASLDSASGKVIMDTLKILNKEGQTIIMVSHEPEYYKQAKRVITLSDGKIISNKKIRKSKI